LDPASSISIKKEEKAQRPQRPRRLLQFPRTSHVQDFVTLSTYNLFESTRKLGIKILVWASSETILVFYSCPTPPSCQHDNASVLRNFLRNGESLRL
jgi:hypothetical protein